MKQTLTLCCIFLCNNLFGTIYLTDYFPENGIEGSPISWPAILADSPASCSDPILNPITVTDNSGTPSDNAACHNGDISFGASVESGGTPPFSYSWNASPAGNVTFVNNAVSLTGANFQNTTNDAIVVEVSVIVTDANNLEGTTSVSITIAPDLAFTILKIENSGPIANDGVVCFDDVVSLEPDGLPNGSLSYLWSTNETTPTVVVNPPNNNSTTNHSVIISDSYGCSDQGLAGVAGISEVTNTVSYKPACDPSLGPDSVQVQVTGGVPPYQFVVNGNPFGIQNVPWTFQTFLPPGNTVTVEAMETNGCAAPVQTLTLPANPGVLSATRVTVNQTCDHLGSVDLTVAGGTPPYSFLWSNGATTEDLTDVPAALYLVQLTDVFGCEESIGALVQMDVNWTWYEDSDGDGFGNPNVSVSSCDPHPGFVLGNNEDCDDDDPLEFPDQVWYLDADGDFYSNGTTMVVCERPPNHLALSELISTDFDCNDNNVAVHPGATEVCNGLDDNCDGLVDNGLDINPWYFDGDGDGYGSGEPINDCQAPGTGYVTLNGDCNDNDLAIYPGAAEVCNGIDDDCDDSVDEGIALLEWYDDGDGDGYGSGEPILDCQSPGTGYVILNGDCNDNDPAIYPAATEVCNGIDDDCDESVDEGVAELDWYFDGDGDGYGAGAPISNCDSPGIGYVQQGGDCDDDDPLVNPGQSEINCNGKDDDCNPSTPDGFDADGDGYSACDGDCDDGDPFIHPGADEVCDGADNDCDETVDENPVSGPTWYADTDNDNFGDPNNSVIACSMPTGFTDNALDCNDGNPNVHPIADELCNGMDDDCDGEIDEFAVDSPTWYHDADGDGFGNLNAILVQCSQPTGYVGNFDDCDDTNPTLHPNTVWHVDFDGDGFGNPNSPVTACSPGAGYVMNNGDCDDSVAAINPGANEICDGLDNDCDENVDEGYDNDNDGWTTCMGDCQDWNPNIYPGAIENCNYQDDDCDGQIDEEVQTLFYYDWDNDGFGTTAITTTACYAPPNFSTVAGDCNDNSIMIYPGAPEVCDGFDNNCDGQIDEGFDMDGDGFSICQGDCEDNNPNIHPNATETCDGIDNNCDGQTDEGLSWDWDNDGYTSASSCLGTANDCNDWNPNINPGSPEICNWQDDNCNGNVDEGIGDYWYRDADWDGFGDPNDVVQSCWYQWGRIQNDGDCDDSNGAVHPNANEVCDGIDNDCDGIIDNPGNGPDLIVLSASFPANVNQGQSISVSGTIENQGNQSSGPNRVYWYLSQDAVISPNDYRPNSWRRPTNNIGSGNSKNFSKNITIPSNGWTGPNFLIFRADGQFQVSESCENNNDIAYPINITNNLLGSGTDGRSFSFNAQKDGFETALYWAAKFEQDIVGMTVERSFDGSSFSSIYEWPNLTMKAGINELFNQYDRMPRPGNNYYRVLFKLADGTTDYTETRLVNFVELENFDVVPNPANNFINVRLKRFEGRDVDVVLFDRFAREVFRQQLKSLAKEWLQIDLTDAKFKDGLYILSVIENGRSISKRIVITK